VCKSNFVHIIYLSDKARIKSTILSLLKFEVYHKPSSVRSYVEVAYHTDEDSPATIRSIKNTK
jgi:hypothetical protein